MNSNSLALVIGSVLLTSVGQLFLKLGASTPGLRRALAQGGGRAIVDAAFGAPFLWLGLFIYGLATIVWVIVLSRIDLSLAYPFVSLGFVAVLALSVFVLGETPNATRLIGSLVIAIGCVMVARSA